MKKTYQDSLFYLVVFATSYFIYIYPFEILSDFILNEKVSRQNSFYSTLFVSFLVIYYFRSHNTFFLLKLFVHEGMGVGFISFWIINLALIISLTISLRTLGGLETVCSTNKAFDFNALRWWALRNNSFI